MLNLPVADLRKPLLLRRLHNPHSEDHAVYIDAGAHGRLRAGRILANRRTGLAVVWTWTVTGLAAPEAPVNLYGDADTLEDAKVALRAAYEALLCWSATRNGGELRWLPIYKTQ